MKAVDFIVELTDRILFIEVKDPQDPHSQKNRRDKFVSKFKSGELERDLKYKYRDSFLYEWASNNTPKPIYYLILIAIDTLTNADLITRTDSLKRNLPVDAHSSKIWTKKLAGGCAIFNIKTWNNQLPQFPVSRMTS